MTTAHHGKAFHGGEHYENFPVGSWLVPAEMRSAVLAFYAFARTGDDLADEGEFPAPIRIQALGTLLRGLTSGRPAPQSPIQDLPDQSALPDLTGLPDAEHLFEIGSRLRHALDHHQVGTTQAELLVSAFLQDAAHQPMQTEEDVLDYCNRSANTVGRLVLALAGLLGPDDEPAAIRLASDAICTGLQLANFAQDMGQDAARGRTYAPQSWALQDQTLLAVKMARWSQRKLNEGAHLPQLIRRFDTSLKPSQHNSLKNLSNGFNRLRLSLEIALCIEGGLEICRQVLADPMAVWTASPSISKARLMVVVLRSIRRALT